MRKAVINVRTDPETKQLAQDLAESCGLTLSALINIQLKQFINNRRLTIDAPYPTVEVNATTAKLLDKINKEVDAGQVSKGFANADDFIADLKP